MWAAWLPGWCFVILVVFLCTTNVKETLKYVYIVRTYQRTVSVYCHKKCKYFFVLRTSGAGGSRNSQYGVFGTEKIKDPRPVNDKAFIQQCIKQLCEVTCLIILKIYY